ncbi:glycosyltransferase family 4 protein [Pseudomonas sp. KK4]|uniref:glycosyltransferase family 4 protein n=1 Tax=Pseudomonas sp. KK4 TaxID=1855729 RepID=UPI00097C8ABF|nr:glycosyltransferase family 4 protein [Pseudomonas sp. KK4]
MTIRVLVLSFYYPPDLAAGSFRVEALVKALLAEPCANVRVDVVTTQPNRYHSFGAAAAEFQECSRLTIRRIALPIHKNGLLDQARAFASYALGVSRAIKGKDYDLVVASSSRLMTATLGACVGFFTKTPLYLDIRDIFVDTLPELFPSRLGKIATWIFSRIERLTIGRAARVNLISPGFLSYFSAHYPRLSFSTHTNGVDELFFKKLPGKHGDADSEKLLKVVYAGNIGAGQGLHLILPALAKRLEGVAHFCVIGAGGLLGHLQLALKNSDVSNVEVIAPVQRKDLLKFYQEADVLFLHLNSFKSFRRVIPSKLFEYAATGKPILAGLAGYSARFTNTKISNASVFEPCDVEGAIEALFELSLEPVTREAFMNEYSRISIQKRMAMDVLSTLER